MTHRMAIIGLGIMGRRMLENALQHPAFEVSGVWDPSTDSVAKTRQTLPAAPVAESAQAAMAGADVVYLSCPPGPRKAYALQAAAAGQGVFMEKPLGTDNAQSRDLLAQLSQARLPGVVNFTQAASRGFAELQRAIDTDETGELLGIDIVVNYPAWPRAWQKDADWLRLRHEGGYTREVISHFLFLAGRFLGPLTLQHASPRYPQDPTLCELDMLARLTTADGRPVTVMATTGGQQPDRQEVTVRGSRMNHQFREFYQLWRSDGGPWQEALDWSTEDPRTSALQRQLTEADLWLKGQPHKLATAEEALAVQELVEVMLVC
ncbi:Gfo/Idh/MocA family protein [Limnohabitans radicicola]|uniref:Gfo/Idh/MocA family oxidoreductase n=1 Tax=Limnohabitans radicicola TaxID=2771427 RepID=A0A927IK27_9BURK|nr:Gfo/Idh/MocA family oxidoreductase [Limnohabitans radicicola]MBD8049193.1 Gfo/Idh/MocA family oxidoreductase [Limnohabitans radicicola]